MKASATGAQVQRAIDRRMRRGRHAELLSERVHASGEPFEFEPFAASEIIGHRRTRFGREVSPERRDMILVTVRHRMARRRGHRNALVQQLLHELSRFRVGQDRADAGAHQAGAARKG